METVADPGTEIDDRSQPLDQNPSTELCPWIDSNAVQLYSVHCAHVARWWSASLPRLRSPTVAETKMDEHFPLDDDDGGDDDRVLIPCPSAMILDQDSQRDGNDAATSKAQESNHPAPPSPSLLQQLLCDKIVRIRDNYPEIGLKKLLKELKVSRSTVFPTGLLCASCARIVNISVHMHKY